jgi:hypothetical protein
MQRIYQLKISLRGTDPLIWRRVLVPGELTLGDLHSVIQRVMGWDGDHLHQFSIGAATYGTDEGELDEDAVTLDEALGTRVKKLTYLYDFGDSWVHEIHVEKLPKEPEALAAPRCIGGERAAPLEDCGGPWGYQTLLEVLEDPEHPDRGHFEGFVASGFDPARFDVDETDARLSGVGAALWIGGVVAPTFGEHAPGAPLPSIAMWLDESDGSVIGQAPADPAEWREAAVELLEAALEDVATGDLARPARVKVADDSLAAAIRPKLDALGLPLELGELPALDELERSLSAEMARIDREGDQATECVDAEIIPDPLIARFFQSAARLYRAEPWACCVRGALFSLSAPKLDLPEGVVALDGDSDREFSIVLFESPADYEAFIAANEAQDDSETVPPPTVVLRALSYDRGASIPRDVRRLISEKGWEVAHARAYPALVVIEPEGAQRPPTARDHQLLSAAAQAVAAAVVEQREALVDGAELTMQLVVDGGEGTIEATLRAGHWDGDADGEVTYDPAAGPSDPERWLELDEHERLDAIAEAHAHDHGRSCRGPEMERPHAHNAFHMIVENQLALDDPPQAREALARLVAQGLERHSAIHAIAEVVKEHLTSASRTGRAFSSASYAKHLAKIDRGWWLSKAVEPPARRAKSKSKATGGKTTAKKPAKTTAKKPTKKPGKAKAKGGKPAKRGKRT